MPETYSHTYRVITGCMRVLQIDGYCLFIQCRSMPKEIWLLSFEVLKFRQQFCIANSVWIFFSKHSHHSNVYLSFAFCSIRFRQILNVWSDWLPINWNIQILTKVWSFHTMVNRWLKQTNSMNLHETHGAHRWKPHALQRHTIPTLAEEKKREKKVIAKIACNNSTVWFGCWYYCLIISLRFNVCMYFAESSICVFVFRNSNLVSVFVLFVCQTQREHHDW